MSPNTPNPDEALSPIDDLKVVERYLRYAIELKEPVSCYAEDPQLSFEAATAAFEPETLRLQLVISRQSFGRMGPWELSGLDRPRTKLRLSYSVNEVTFYLHSVFQERSGAALTVRIDLPVLKLQRREALRIKLLPSHKAAVKLGPDLFFALFDISAGGLGIIVTENQKQLLEAKKTFPQCRLAFSGREFTVDLELKSVRLHGKIAAMFKAGFVFRQLPASVEQTIAREAYLHTHKIWSRWLD